MKLGHGSGWDGLLEVFVVPAVLRSIQNLHESGGYRIKAWLPCQRDLVGPPWNRRSVCAPSLGLRNVPPPGLPEALGGLGCRVSETPKPEAPQPCYGPIASFFLGLMKS